MGIADVGGETEAGITVAIVDLPPINRAMTPRAIESTTRRLVALSGKQQTYEKLFVRSSS
jgi:hypothetical protein